MKKIKTIVAALMMIMLVVASFRVITSCVQKDRVQSYILNYSDQMEIYDEGESTEGVDLIYLAETTAVVANGDDVFIVATRFNSNADEYNMIALVILYYDVNDKQFKIDEMLFISYNNIDDAAEGYQISLEANNIVLVDSIETYIEKLKTLTYEDFEYVMITIIDSN